MRVLILSPNANLIEEPIRKGGDEVVIRYADTEVSDWPEADMAVSFGYRKIIPAYKIKEMPRRIINIHGGMLPYNRGANPNFWSWFDDTPKGVTIHYVNEGVDTGEFISAQEMGHGNFRSGHTLRTTYEDILILASGLFTKSWRAIREDDLPEWRDRGHGYATRDGSYHRSSDIDKYFHRLSAGWDTDVYEVRALGQIYRRGLGDQT